MLHLLSNVDENWRNILSSSLVTDTRLYNFLSEFSEGNLEENIFPRPQEIFRNFEEVPPNYNVILITGNPKERNLSPFQEKILHLYVHMTYGSSFEENLRHKELWSGFLNRIIKFLHQYSPVYVAVGPEAVKPLYMLSSDKIFQERPGLRINLEEDIQYTPVVLQTTKITENTIVLINQLLKHKKKPLLKLI